MTPLPDTKATPVLRTAFSSDAGWRRIVESMMRPSIPDGFKADLTPVDDPAFADWDVETIRAAAPARYPEWGHPIVFVVDDQAIADPESGVLAIDLSDDLEAPFRILPSVAWSLENNLSLANMDYLEFAESADPDGVFRGF